MTTVSAGEHVVAPFVLLWMSLTVGPWWVGLGIFVVVWVVNMVARRRTVAFTKSVTAASAALREAQGTLGDAVQGLRETVQEVQAVVDYTGGASTPRLTLVQEPRCDCGDNEPPPAGPAGPCPVHGKE